MLIDPVQFPEQQVLTTFFAHHLWANQQVLEACRALTESQLAHVVTGTYGSIHEALVHLVRAEERYLAHLRGQDPNYIGSPNLTTSLTELQMRLHQSSTGLLQLVASLDTNARVRVGEGEKLELIPAAVFLLQAIYHAHEHRTQINTILGQLGITPPALNAWDYYDNQASKDA